jgi:hypothetical protein
MCEDVEVFFNDEDWGEFEAWLKEEQIPPDAHLEAQYENEQVF